MRESPRPSSPPDYWDAIGREWGSGEPQRLWRAHCDRLTARLLRAWLPSEPVARLLKTDLFDEANGGADVVALLAGGARNVVGIDIARATLTRRHIEGDYAAATAEFARWNRAGGRVLQGLVRRRAAEAALYTG